MGQELQPMRHDFNLEEPFQDEESFTMLNDNSKIVLDVEMSTKVKGATKL